MKGSSVCQAQLRGTMQCKEQRAEAQETTPLKHTHTHTKCTLFSHRCCISESDQKKKNGYSFKGSAGIPITVMARCLRSCIL